MQLICKLLIYWTNNERYLPNKEEEGREKKEGEPEGEKKIHIFIRLLFKLAFKKSLKIYFFFVFNNNNTTFHGSIAQAPV